MYGEHESIEEGDKSGHATSRARPSDGCERLCPNPAQPLSITSELSPPALLESAGERVLCINTYPSEPSLERFLIRRR